MRVTNSLIKQNALTGLQLNMRRVLDAQNQATTGRRIERASDDPVGASQVIRSGSTITALAQYQRNIDSANARLAAEETVLDRLDETISRAKELGLQQGGSTANTQTRLVAKAEVDQLLAFTKELGNTRHEGEFLFGGNASQTVPFTAVTPPFTAAAPSGTRQTEIASGFRVPLNHDGDQVFLSSGVLQSLYDLSDALGRDDTADINTALQSLDGAQDSINTLLGDVGARTQQLEVTSANLDALDTQTKTLKSQLEDADIERAVTELVTRQTAYQAAMLATSRVIGLSLADYLR
jgi:flagellar hook-associated protein 3 FlgL